MLSPLVASRYRDAGVLAPGNDIPSSESAIELVCFPMNRIKDLIEEGHLRDSAMLRMYERLIDEIKESHLANDRIAGGIYEELKNEIIRNHSLQTVQLRDYNVSPPMPYGVFEAILMATCSAFLRFDTERNNAIQELIQIKKLIETTYNPKVLEHRQELIQRDKRLFSGIVVRSAEDLPDDPVVRAEYFNSIFYYQYEPILSLGLAAAFSVTHYVEGEEAERRLESIYREIPRLPDWLAQELMPVLSLAIIFHLSNEDRKEQLKYLGRDAPYETNLLETYLKRVRHDSSLTTDADLKIAYDVILAYVGRTVIKLREYLQFQLDNQEVEVNDTYHETVSSIDRLEEVIFEDPVLIREATERIKAIEESAHFTLQGPIFLGTLLNRIPYLRSLPFALEGLFLDPHHYSEHRDYIGRWFSTSGLIKEYEELQRDFDKVIELSKQYQSEKTSNMTANL